MDIENRNIENREYKDSVFVNLFSVDELTRCEAVMQLYNALHQEKIKSEDEIKFVRLANVLFRKVRNDVSFIVNNRLLILLEHQSTINENLPFRCLEYVIALYQSIIDQRVKFLPKKMTLFAPEFYVIYNGDVPYPARKVLSLSSLFKKSEKKPQLELFVTIININHPDNEEFLDSCPFLKDFKNLAHKVKEYKRLYGKEGYVMAIEECIKDSIKMSDYLKRNMQEVAQMFSAEYNYLAELEASQMVGLEQGIEKGRMEGRMEGLMEGRLIMARVMKDENCPISLIIKTTGLSKEKIEAL